MRRRGFNILVAASTALFAINLALWVQGYIYTLGVAYARFDASNLLVSVGLNSQNGEWFFHHGRNVPRANQQAGFSFGGARNRDPTFVIRWSHAGFFLFTFDYGDGTRFTQGALPNWFIALVTAPLPIMWFIRRRRQRRRAMQGRCAGCGYDLRATIDRCPECGLATGATCST